MTHVTGGLQYVNGDIFTWSKSTPTDGLVQFCSNLTALAMELL